MKKILIILIFALTSCGYQPLYSNKNSNKIIFKDIELIGDKNINNIIISGTFINQNSEQYTHEKIILKNNKNIIETSKDSKGQPDTYKMTITLDVFIKDKQNNIREIIITEDFSYKNLENKFDLSEYEISVESDLLKKISDQLIVYLSL
tara:strand:- start:2854 stop:3300 length:447 start_codon:yes stop_codon:yes gene_type:complete